MYFGSLLAAGLPTHPSDAMRKWTSLLALLFVVVVLAPSPIRAQPAVPDTVLLWPEGAPGAVGDKASDRPTLTVHRPAPEEANGTAVVVFPGGGYRMLAMEKEGHRVARWLNSLGVTAFVLKYRLGPRYRHPAPLQDAKRALRYVRLHADEYGVNPERLGVWGFSAGGHLAATTGTHFDRGDTQAEGPIDRMSARPDFLVLAYPVITFTEDYMHRGSRTALLGENPDSELVENLSAEKQVTPETPPTFLFHTSEDTGVPAENSIAFYKALHEAGVPAELHIYEQGRHGVGMAPEDYVLSSWTDRLADWLLVRGFL